VWSLTQTPPEQNVMPGLQSLSVLHPHWPAMQAAPAPVAAQLFPQVPQLLTVVTSVHVPPQHAWPCEHVVPQLPQLLASVCLFTQVPLHRSGLPCGHEVPHTPATQVAVPPVAARHTFPQL
jgi:hypothetical protein